jgi:hypothetical protein
MADILRCIFDTSMKRIGAMRRITLVAAALSVAAGAPSVAEQDSQGFLRVVEGAATLIRVEDGRPEAARENTPALAGDRLSLAPGSRVEVILPDGHRLRLAQSADLALVALARSLDEAGEATALQLTSGALAIDVPLEVSDRTRIDTDAAAVLLERGGLYLIEIDERSATRVVVRNGEAEVLTEYDSTLVRAGDEAVVDRDARDRVALYQAPPLTDVELWARQLEAEAARADVEPVEPELRYAAQPLARYGTWVNGGTGYAWRPRVEAGWRPYWRGYWKYSPAGLVWSSYEPWGWVPYHYGSWDLHPSYGWLWYPGAVYRPAHVVWYWGSSYTGWVPSGYYASFYGRRFGFHLSFGSGFYGVSHAGWHAYRDWVFCPRGSIGHHYQYRHHGDHRVLAHHGRFDRGERAFITADTRGIDRGHWRDAGAVEAAVTRRAHRRTGGGGPSELPDVTAVVARSPEVSDTMLRNLDLSDDERRIAVHRRPGPRGGLDGAPAAAPTGGEPGGQKADAGRPSTRVARRPGVLADDGVAREAPGGGAGTVVTPAEGGRTAIRAHRSGGPDSPSSTVVRDRRADRGTPTTVKNDGPTDRDAAAPIEPAVRREPRVDPRRIEVDSTGSTQRRPAVVRRDQSPAPRSYEPAPQKRQGQAATGGTGSSSEVRARETRPRIDRVAPTARTQSDRRTQAEGSYPPRAVSRQQVQRSYSPPSPPRAQVQVAPSNAANAARPAPRAPIQRPNAPPSAPAVHQRAARESRGGPPAVSSAPAPRRIEQARSAPAESRTAPSSKGGDGGGRPQARSAGGESNRRSGGEGGRQASRRH